MAIILKTSPKRGVIIQPGAETFPKQLEILRLHSSLPLLIALRMTGSWMVMWYRRFRLSCHAGLRYTPVHYHNIKKSTVIQPRPVAFCGDEESRRKSTESPNVDMNTKPRYRHSELDSESPNVDRMMGLIKTWRSRIKSGMTLVRDGMTLRRYTPLPSSRGSTLIIHVF